MLICYFSCAYGHKFKINIMINSKQRERILFRNNRNLNKKELLLEIVNEISQVISGHYGHGRRNRRSFLSCYIFLFRSIMGCFIIIIRKLMPIHMEQASRPFTCNNKLLKNMASIMKKKLKKKREK